jgi:hypothetical protein
MSKDLANNASGALCRLQHVSRLRRSYWYYEHSCRTFRVELAENVGQQRPRRVQPDDFADPVEQESILYQCLWIEVSGGETRCHF